MRDLIQHSKDHYTGNSIILVKFQQRTSLLRSTNEYMCVHEVLFFSRLNYPSSIRKQLIVHLISSLIVMKRGLENQPFHTLKSTPPKAFFLSFFIVNTYTHFSNNFPVFSGLLYWLKPVVFSLFKQQGFPCKKIVFYFAFAFPLDLFSH